MTTRTNVLLAASKTPFRDVLAERLTASGLTVALAGGPRSLARQVRDGADLVVLGEPWRGVTADATMLILAAYLGASPGRTMVLDSDVERSLDRAMSLRASDACLLSEPVDRIVAAIATQVARSVPPMTPHRSDSELPTHTAADEPRSGEDTAPADDTEASADPPGAVTQTDFIGETLARHAAKIRREKRRRDEK